MPRIKILILLWLFSVLNSIGCSSYWHPNPVKYVGDYLKSENISSIDFCDKKICIIDADRVALWMNETANPCDNIYKYACGSLIHYVRRIRHYF